MATLIDGPETNVISRIEELRQLSLRARRVLNRSFRQNDFMLSGEALTLKQLADELEAARVRFVTAEELEGIYPITMVQLALAALGQWSMGADELKKFIASLSDLADEEFLDSHLGLMLATFLGALAAACYSGASQLRAEERRRREEAVHMS